ncbi:MAG: type III-B CRISPR module RAMP protein Cmr4 [Caldisericia bacterium]|nr:type III-B CRISPR module RAMP protein Cmr4 [Caldisericia bacterium]
MYKIIKPLIIKTITPMHCGTGQDLGIVDMPIQRERHTGFPKIEGSSLKGALRESFEDKVIKDKEDNIYKIEEKFIKKVKAKYKEEYKDLEKKWMEIKKENEVEKKDKNGIIMNKYQQNISLTFGPENGDDHASSLGFTDGRILFFPVKSVKGVFAWITCPSALNRAIEEFEMAGVKFEEKILKRVTVNSDNAKVLSDELAVGNSIILEEYSFVKQDFDNNDKAIIEVLCTNMDICKNRIAILSDNDFKDFVEMSTEVITRTKIDADTGTVVDGALFTEEYLPAESIMYSLVMASPVFLDKTKNNSDIKTDTDVMSFFKNCLDEYVQIGGNATIGKGICAVKVVE